MKRTNFDEFAHSYDQVLAESLNRFGADVGYYHRYKVKLVKALARGPVESVLEYGCGAGANLGLLRDAFPEASISGCDVSSESVRVAAARHPGCRLFDLAAKETPPGPFDLIFISNVLHHVPPGERPTFMAEAARLLAPGGDLFIFEHNPKNPLTRRVVRDCPLDDDAILLHAAEAERLGVQAGLRLIRRRYALFFPVALKILAGLERYLGRLPLGAQHYVQFGKDESWRPL
jgi:ubiquinone/menaquinone biosynthesis C-methylase UbiE